jgi:ribosome-associated translation inhibitor RaiA
MRIMETPAQIDFQGMKANADIRAAIDRHIAELEERFGRVTACRVAVRAPSARHRNGSLYGVSIHVMLPSSREVNVDRTAPEDERHADVDFALNDAFKRARRRLQAEVQVMRRHVKAHADRGSQA